MPPVLSLDLTQPDAHLHLLTWLTWPNDAEQRRLALANHFLHGRANLERPETQAAIHTVSEQAWWQVAREGGTTLEAVQARPGAESVVHELAGEHIARGRQSLEEKLLMPAGGWPVVDRASWRREQGAIGQAVSPIRAVGQALSLVHRLYEHHSHVAPASLNRALAIMQAEKAQYPYDLPTSRTVLQWWNERRGISPLYAALDLMLHQPRHHTASPLTPLTTEQGLRDLFGHAKGLRQWAIGFKPRHGQEPLIPEAEAVVYDVEAPECLPGLGPLNDLQRKAARAYRATNR